jgi:hypothetical protein
MPPVGFEHTIPVFEQGKTVHALALAATLIDSFTFYLSQIQLLPPRKHTMSLLQVPVSLCFLEKQ